MPIYVGFYSVDPDFNREVREKLRNGSLQLAPFEVPEPARTKALGLLKNLPPGCKIVGSWFPADQPASTDQPGVLVIETQDVSHLAWFNNYYGGLVQFRFHPYVAVQRG